MEYESVLLIGGPRDGDWISVLKGIPTIRMPQRPTAQDPQLTYDVHEYVRVPFESRKGVKGAVFTCGDVDLLAALIEGYRKP